MHARPATYNTRFTSNHDLSTCTLTAQMLNRMTVCTIAHHLTREFCNVSLLPSPNYGASHCRLGRCASAWRSISSTFDSLLRCTRSRTTRYACSSLTNCNPALRSLTSCSTGAVCSSFSMYSIPCTLKLRFSCAGDR